MSPRDGDVVEQILEAARLGLRQPLEQLLDARLDRDLLRRQRHRRPLAGALEHAPERRQQAEEIDLQLGLVSLAGNRLDARIGPRPLRAAQRLALVQQLGGGLELLVLEQPPDQRVARVFVLVVGSPAADSGRGSSMRLLMWMSVAAITRNSLATSRLSSCIRSR